LATGWTARGSNSAGDWRFSPLQSRTDRHWCSPTPLYNGYGALSRGSSSRGLVLTTHPYLASRLKTGRAVPLLPSCASITRCKESFVLPSLATNLRIPEGGHVRMSTSGFFLSNSTDISELCLLFFCTLHCDTVT